MDFRPIEAGDMRWLYAAYKGGALSEMGEAFAQPDKDAPAFKAAFEAHVLANYDAAWTLFALTGKGFIPVGVVFGVWERLSPFMLVAGIAWFPWATNRNIIEAVVNFFNGVRKQCPMMLYALPHQRGAYEVCCKHAILHRVGTSRIAFPGNSAAVYETRA